MLDEFWVIAVVCESIEITWLKHPKTLKEFFLFEIVYHD
jgi:hypothetical protein